MTISPAAVTMKMEPVKTSQHLADLDLENLVGFWVDTYVCFFSSSESNLECMGAAAFKMYFPAYVL